MADSTVTRLLIVAFLLLTAYAVLNAATTSRANACAFARVPTTYEAGQSRGAYIAGLNLAAYNMLFPTDTFFGTPRIETGTRTDRRNADTPYIPPTLLKAIGWIESALTQGSSATPWGSVGPTLVSFDCGHGIMQVTSGMTAPTDAGQPSRQQALVAEDYLYNIGRGAAILADKWNGAPEYRPIAGTNTGGDGAIVENWYFALWGYNGFTGPGANRSNHPMDPIYAAWPRTGFSCGSLNDGYGHSYSTYPYQEIVMGCMARPPSVSGTQLWTPLPASLPDLSDPLWSGPLDLSNWASCASPTYDCAAMDIPSPQPAHHDDTPRPEDGAAGYLLGAPTLAVNRSAVSDDVSQVVISNTGTSILPWRAVAGQPWISLDKQGGVAISQSMTCSDDCERSPTLTISVADAPGASGWVDIESLTTGQVARVQVFSRRFDVNCDGATNPIDALVLLQYAAGLVPSLQCEANADANDDGVVNPLDAALILQFNAGLYIPTPVATASPTAAPTPVATAAPNTP